KSLVNTCSKPTDTSLIISNVLNWYECQSLIAFMNMSPVLEPVSVQGFCNTELDTIGSHRTTIWSAELAKKLWRRLQDFFHPEEFTATSPTDWWQGDLERTKWEPIGISPMLRFMNYAKGGEHY